MLLQNYASWSGEMTALGSTELAHSQLFSHSYTEHLWTQWVSWKADRLSDQKDQI